jgi:hypothetical protein
VKFLTRWGVASQEVSICNKEQKKLGQDNPQSTLTSFTTTVYPPELPQILGGLDPEIVSNFIENEIVDQKYCIVEGIASGHHWYACLAKRKADGKQVSYSN